MYMYMYMLHSPSYIIELASNQRPANWVLMYTVNSFKCLPVDTRGPTGMLISSHSPDSLSTLLIEWQLSFEWGPSAMPSMDTVHTCSRQLRAAKITSATRVQ